MKLKRRWILLAGLAICGCRAAPPDWTAEELSTLRSLSIDSLGPPPPDPSNAVADNASAAELGRRLFSDPRFSADGRVACTTCHQPERDFTDGLAKSQGLGITQRHAPTIIGAAYSPWQFWDGRADSLWAQALAPLEHATEHGFSRTEVARRLFEAYRSPYEALFGPLPDLSDRSRFPERASPLGDADAQAAWDRMAPADRAEVDRIFANAGKSIAAFERSVQPGPARFDAYIAAALADDRDSMAQALTSQEAEGLRLFIGKARCTQCHSGPRLTNDAFHNTGLPAAQPALDQDPTLPDPSIDAIADAGRADGVWKVIADPFNCLGSFSDAAPEDCAELNHIEAGGHTAAGAFKTPTLREVADTAPYMHAGQFASLRAVIEHYNAAPTPFNGASDLVPLNLSSPEIDALEAFLESLSSQP